MPTARVLPTRKRESRKRGKLRGIARRQLSGSHRAARSKELGGIALQGRRHRDAHHRHAGLSAWAMRRRSRRSYRAELGVPFERDPLLAGRQRRTDHRRRHRRLAFAHAQRHRDRRSGRQSDREGQAGRAPCAGSRRGRHRISTAAASSSPAPTARSASWNSPHKLRTRRQAAGRTRRNRSTSTHASEGRCRRPSPTAATSPKSRSIPKPASSRW